MRPICTASLVVFCLLVAPALLSAEDLPSPAKAYNAMVEDMKNVPAAEQDAAKKERAIEYLGKWKASGKAATGSSAYALAQFYKAAEQYKEAATGFRGVHEDTSQKEKTRDYAISAEAGLLLLAGARAELGDAALAEMTDRLAKVADGMEGEAKKSRRSTLRHILSRAYDLAGNSPKAHAMRMTIVQDDSSYIPKLIQPIVSGLLGSAHTMEGYAKARKEAEAAMVTLSAKQAGVRDEAKARYEQMREQLESIMPEALDEAGNLKKTNPREMNGHERALYNAKQGWESAEGVLTDIAGATKPFALLGAAAPAIEVEKSWGEDAVAGLADLKGDVIVMDFWATWIPACNFPVMRDLVRDYGEKGLTVLGVTCSAHVCYESRYDMDEDHKEKWKGGRLQYAARLETEDSPADGQYILDEVKYRLVEKQVIETFLGNHGLTWPQVMIDKDETTKFGRETWPHVVVLDKQGRVRFFKGGAMERDDKVAIDSLRKLIEVLLAE